MSSTSKTYRICAFDGQQRILTADWLEAASDEQAIAAVEAMGFGSLCEIWDERRLVARLAAETAASPPPFDDSGFDGPPAFAC